MKAMYALGQTLRSLKGNQRACVVTEPLWAIPYYLFLPFVSVYMSALGLSDAQIGAVASLSFAMQFFWGLLSGAIVDKYGRRGTMLVFGLLSWTIPCALWATAQSFWHFLLAAACNSMWRVTGNSFSCMILEDGDTGHLVHIYTVLNVIGLLAGFLSPLVGLCIGRFALVPVMRGLYFASMGLMTVKFLLQYRLARESGMGKQRMRECRGSSLLALAFGGWPAFVAAMQRRRTLLCVVLMILMTCFQTIQANFWPLFVATAYGVSDAMLSVFPTVKTVVTLLTYLLIAARIRLQAIRLPLLAALGAQGAGLLALLLLLPMGGGAIGAVFLSAACDAFAMAVLTPLCESLMSLNIPDGERARINSLIFGGILLVSTPVGWIAGQLAQYGRALPLMMNVCLVAAEIAVALYIIRSSRKEA